MLRALPTQELRRHAWVDAKLAAGAEVHVVSAALTYLCTWAVGSLHGNPRHDPLAAAAQKLMQCATSNF